MSLGFWVWLILIGGPVAVSLVLAPDQYRFNYQPETFIPFAIVGLLLLPIQTTAEELFFVAGFSSGQAGVSETLWCSL